MTLPYHVDLVRYAYGDRPMMECLPPFEKSNKQALGEVFTHEQVEHAVKIAPRIKGVFEKAYQAPTFLSHYKVIANTEIALAGFANNEIKLERLQIAEAALDIYDFLKGC